MPAKGEGIVPNLSDRIRALAADVQQGDTSGELKLRIENVSENLQDQINDLREDLHQLMDSFQKQQSGNG